MDIVQIRIAMSNGRFSASADVYVGAGELTEAAELVTGFPTNPKDTRELHFGSFGPDFAGGAVRLQFMCTDLAGHTRMTATVEDDHLSREQKQVQQATIFMDFEPAALDDFVMGLRRLEQQHNGCAKLRGHRRS